MKRNIFIYTILVSFLFASCKKDDGMVKNSITLERVPYMSLTKEAGSPSEIIPSTITTFTGKLVVSPLYPSDALPTKVDVVVIKNGNTNNVKTLRAGITTFPTVISWAGTELATLFNQPTVTCDQFTFGTIIYVGNKKYETWPAAGGPGFAAGTQINQPGYSVTINYNTKVEYDPSIYQGNFVVVSDEFEDFAVGSTVAITQVSPTKFSFIQPAVTNPQAMVFTVDPATLGVSLIPKQKIGDAFTWPPFYTNPNVSVTVNAAQSFVSPCSKTITLMMNYSIDQGAYPAYKLVLRKP